MQPSSSSVSLPLPQELSLNSGQDVARATVTSPWFPIAAWQALQDDFRIIFERDPAAHHWLEVLCCYPGFHAIVLYRLAHWLHRRGVVFIPRLISHLARFLTGIEIHPGAVLGKGVFIDHGMGVVIGETAIVGDYCLIYQGVTLGGTGKETGKRHPTLGNHVVVGAGAKILGNISIGDYARVGAGSIVLRSVPSYCTAVGVPSRNICRTNTKTRPLDHGQVPDIEAAVVRMLTDRIERLEQQLQQLTHTSPTTTSSPNTTSSPSTIPPKPTATLTCQS
ncbi:MAG: serine O-acetyltransferase [Cyanobacteria bacterium]|nr:serine O-acetyltransferase [Cyanobacteriota bacterium]MDW8200327.1 serine O-acetyltransferase [Cyanobacteriota bacterium SKYGB_h_bin112]